MNSSQFLNLDFGAKSKLVRATWLGPWWHVVRTAWCRLGGVTRQLGGLARQMVAQARKAWRRQAGQVGMSRQIWQAGLAQDAEASGTTRT